MFCKNVPSHTHTKCHHIYQQMLKEAPLQMSTKLWKLLPAKRLLTELFIILLSVLFKKELPPTHTHQENFSLVTVLLTSFAFSETLACFYLRDAGIHLTDLVSIVPLVTVQCRAKSSHCIACILLSFLYLPFTLVNNKTILAVN